MNGNDQNNGVIKVPKNMLKETKTQEGCLNWCLKQKSVTGCEFQTGGKKCFAHTLSVARASWGNKGSVCYAILPRGLFMKAIKQSNFFKSSKDKQG